MFDPAIVEAQQGYSFNNRHYARFAGAPPLVRHIEIDLAMIDADNEVLPGEIEIDFMSETTKEQRQQALAALKAQDGLKPELFDGNILIKPESGIITYDAVRDTLVGLLMAGLIQSEDVIAAARALGLEPPTATRMTAGK